MKDEILVPSQRTKDDRSKNEDLNIILPNGLADPLGMELFRIVKPST